MQSLDIVPKSGASLPSWLMVTDSGVTVKLSTPVVVQEVRIESLSLSTPSVRLLRACQKAHPGDELAVDAMLFASLAQVSVADIENLSLKDYERIKRGYFRMVDEDEL